MRTGSAALTQLWGRIASCRWRTRPDHSESISLHPRFAARLLIGLVGVLSLSSACAEFSAPVESSLERIQREGVLRWGCDTSGGAPFAFNDAENPTEVIGFEVELA